MEDESKDMDFNKRIEELFNELIESDGIEKLDLADTDDDGEEIDNIVVLSDDEGNDVEFCFLDLIEYNGENYAVLLPVEDDDENDELVILKVDFSDDEDEDEVYSSVQDENVLSAVFEIFKQKFKDTFNFPD